MTNGSKMSGTFADDQADGNVELEDSNGNLFQSENDAKATTQKTKKVRIAIKDSAEDQLIPGIFMNGRLYK